MPLISTKVAGPRPTTVIAEGEADGCAATPGPRTVKAIMKRSRREQKLRIGPSQSFPLTRAHVRKRLMTLRTPPRTPHSALRTPHSALRTPHSALRTPHSALRTPHDPILAKRSDAAARCVGTRRRRRRRTAAPDRLRRITSARGRRDATGAGRAPAADHGPRARGVHAPRQPARDYLAQSRPVLWRRRPGDATHPDRPGARAPRGKTGRWRA